MSADEKTILAAQPAFKGDLQYSDVNHSFWVPEARLKVDAVSGLKSYVQWTASHVTNREDRYQVVCAELCGTGHNGMRTDMCVVSQQTFDWWVGLGTDDRTKATCLSLRLLQCEATPPTAPADIGDAIDKLSTLTTNKPNASCKAAQEALA